MSEVFTPTRYKLSVEDYHRLGDAGILNEDSRVELIEGELIEMAPIGGPHMAVVNRLTKLLVLAVGDLGVVSVQNPVRLPPHSEPQPDFAILKPRAGDAVSAVPGPEDVLLLIEVAGATLAYDRGTKLVLYAKSGIAESWIVNLQSKCVEVYREPTTHGYTKRIEFPREERVSPLAFPTMSVAVAEVFE
ncbi:MAG: Uma2 family endonuclease [Gammaproteobacteria bacterium]